MGRSGKDRAAPRVLDRPDVGVDAGLPNQGSAGPSRLLEVAIRGIKWPVCRERAMQ
jgi:hypothetical protein